MISDVGRALCSLLRQQLPPAAAVNLGPPPPNGSDGAAEPAVHLALRWLRDDPNGRQSGDRDVRSSDGTLVGRQAPPRRYELRYLITTRAATAEAEYELLDAALLAVSGLDALPAEVLPSALAESQLPVLLQVCSDQPPGDGVQAHAGFEITVSAPLLPPLQTELAPPAAELSVSMRRTVPPRTSSLRPQPAAGHGDTGDGTVAAAGTGVVRQWRRTRVSEE